MPQVESFSFSDAGGSNKTTATRGTGANTGSWVLGTHVLTPEAFHAMKGAVSDALALNVATLNRYPKVFFVRGGPDVTFNAAVESDPADDTLLVPGLTPWLRSKMVDFVAAIDAYVPLPPGP